MMEPVVKEVFVPVGRDVAFRRFTAEIAEWWPVETHAVFAGEGPVVEFEGHVGGRIVERMPDGREAEWGEVTAWVPPDRVAFTWYPGRTSETAQAIEVTFVAEAGGTRVRLVHGDWEVLGEHAEAAREGYDSGWTTVLGNYTASLHAPV